MDKGFQVLFSFRANCSVSEIGLPLSASRNGCSSRLGQPGRRKPLEVSVKSRPWARGYVRVCRKNVCNRARTRTRARLDCENYVGKTAIRRRCNNLSWMASRVGGNYAELMRSSSCGPRIIYSESASLSPCIARSGFSAAPVCLVSVKNPRDTPQREINFPILLKCLRWPRDPVCRKTAATWHYTTLWIEHGRLPSSSSSSHNVDRILRGVLIEANVSKSSRIKKSERSTKVKTSQT